MKQKELKDLTLKEYDEYIRLTNVSSGETVDTISIAELFGYDVEDMSVAEFRMILNKITNYTIPETKIKLIYKINGKRFKAILKPIDIKAGQFIDFQNYMKDYKTHEVLSVFLIPQYRTWYGVWKTYKYSTGYDALELQEFFYNHFTIGQAKNLATFFLVSSEKSLKIIQDYLTKKLMMKKMKVLKDKKKNQTLLLG